MSTPSCSKSSILLAASLCAFYYGSARHFLYAQEPLTITGDLGGQTVAYQLKAVELAFAKTPIILDGPCASACTLFLQKKWNLNICATRNATLHFHMPYFLEPNTTNIIMNEKTIKDSKFLWNRVWLESYHPQLNRILKTATKMNLIPNPSETGIVNEWFSLSAQSVVKAC